MVKNILTDLIYASKYDKYNLAEVKRFEWVVNIVSNAQNLCLVHMISKCFEKYNFWSKTVLNDSK